MFSTEQITETVRTAAGHIPAGYADRVTAVADAVKAKVDEARAEAAESIRTAAQDLGARETDVTRILTEAGLIDPPVLETATPQDASPVEETVSRLQEQVNSLLRFARNHGYRG